MEDSGDRPSSSSPPSSNRNKHRIPDDTVFYSLYSDSALSSSETSTSLLRSLHLHILDSILSPLLQDYIWQHEPFALSLSLSPIPHLHGKTRFGDNLEDEWFVVFLLYEISRKIPSLSIRVWDSDGEFLLIEAAFSLPRWINPETSSNRVYIRRGELHIVPRSSTRFPSSNPSLREALEVLKTGGEDDKKTRASDSVQLALSKRISGYPERARSNMHRARVRVPLPVAQVLRHEPCFISLAVEGFYDRDVDSMKFASRMEKFLSPSDGDDIVRVSVLMSRAMYGQLVQQKFQAPRGYPMPSLRDVGPVVFREAELGMKIACGFEMVYQQRRRAGEEGEGSTLEVFRKTLESYGYFQGLLPGSKEYSRLMDDALERYRNGTLFSRARDMLSAPVKLIDEVLTLPHSSSDFDSLHLPPDDDDSWLYNGEDELNSAILERQKEIECYESEHRKNQRSRDQKVSKGNPSIVPDDFNLGDITKTMQAFVQKVSSFEGAEVPENRDFKEEVGLDADRFFKDVESVIGPIDLKGIPSFSQYEEGNTTSSDMDFDESEEGSDLSEPPDDDDIGDTFMNSYSDTLKKELNETTLKKSFIRAHRQPSNNDAAEGTSNASVDTEEDFTPVDMDVNLVKSILDSFSCQQGLPGPASNLLGLMGIKLPQDSNKD